VAFAAYTNMAQIEPGRDHLLLIAEHDLPERRLRRRRGHRSRHGETKVRRFLAVDDGVVINPMIVEGRSMRLTEAPWPSSGSSDAEGNNLNTSFTDYLVPTSPDAALGDSQHVTPSSTTRWARRASAGERRQPGGVRQHGRCAVASGRAPHRHAVDS
jgi:hypothetical protein